jgi:hypothetical protein
VCPSRTIADGPVAVAPSAEDAVAATTAVAANTPSREDSLSVVDLSSPAPVAVKPSPAVSSTSVSQKSLSSPEASDVSYVEEVSPGGTETQSDVSREHDTDEAEELGE